MTFFETALSPSGFGLVLFGALLGALVGHILTRCAKTKDDRQNLVSNVAERYHLHRENNSADGIDGLMKSGVCRLRDSNEIEATIKVIHKFGHRDPLRAIREQLKSKNIHSFFVVLSDKKLNALQTEDLKIAIEEARLS